MKSADTSAPLRQTRTASDILLDLFIQQNVGCIDHETEDCTDGITDISLFEEKASLGSQAGWDYFRSAA